MRPPFVDRLMFTEARPAREKRASDQTTATLPSFASTATLGSANPTRMGLPVAGLVRS